MERIDFTRNKINRHRCVDCVTSFPDVLTENMVNKLGVSGEGLIDINNIDNVDNVDNVDNINDASTNYSGILNYYVVDTDSTSVSAWSTATNTFSRIKFPGDWVVDSSMVNRPERRTVREDVEVSFEQFLEMLDSS